MKTMTDVLAMGGYGFYVWTAYGLGCLLLVGNLYWTKLRRLKLKKMLKHHMKRASA